MLSFDRTFQTGAYALREAFSGSARRRVHRFPETGAADASGTVDVVVQAADEQPWTGQFGAAEVPTLDGITGVIALPDGHSFAVFNQGALWVSGAEDPASARCVRSGGIHQAVALRNERLVLCADATSILAFGPQGLEWETERQPGAASDDRLRITGVGSAIVAELRHGDAPVAATREFDPQTGAELVRA